MARPKAGSPTARRRHGSRAARVLARKPRVQGWLTTEEQEIERRRLRAVTEPIEIKAAERRHPIFGTFEVASAAGGRYEVEIRSLSESANSCSCPDHQVNGLGTCKHIEAVLARLPRRSATSRLGGRGTRGSKGEAAARSGRVEIFLDRRLQPPRVRVQWPGAAPPHPLREALAPFFAADGMLRGDALDVLPAVARKLAEQSLDLQRRVRLSRQLQSWVEAERRKAARGAARRHFLAEVEAGRRSLDFLASPLYPYQRDGMLHLAFGERALLADEMGLGKTVQAVAACELLRQLRGIERVLVISPASVKAEWLEQIAKFTSLPTRVIQGPRAMRLRQYGPGSFFYLANYEQVRSDYDEIQRHLAPDVIVLDEAQHIKNWQSKTAQSVKRLRSPFAFVLTGTPIENRIDELYSLVQFLDPSLFGPLFRFNRDFYQLDDRGRPAGLKNLDEMHRRLGGILLRRRKDEVETQLPGRTVNCYFLPMEHEQAVRYEEYERRVARLLHESVKRPLTPEEFDKLQRWLGCMRMLCDTPYILDSDCRVCPKLAELEEILTERLSDTGAKILVFSEWERMLLLVRELVEEMDVGFAWHTGSVPQHQRRREIHRFKNDQGCRLFLSTDSGGLGLNLQAANVVVNLDLPWSPARLEQRIARAWRKHQARLVSVLNLVTQDSIEHRMLSLLAQKQALADGILDGRGELKALALPTGRAAFLERVAAVMGTSAGIPRPEAAAVPAFAPAPTPGLAERDAPQRLREALLEGWSERLLLLSLRGEPDGHQAVFAVLDRVTAKDRAEIAGLVERSFSGPGEAPHPSLEIFDRATFAAIERLVEAGVLQFTATGSTLLHRSPALAPEEEDRERRRRLARARELCEQAERKSRMAALLAGGGFPIEALAPLREALETALRALVLAEEGEDVAHDNGGPAPEVPMAWIETNLSRHDAIDPGTAQLVADLRGRSEALLAVGEERARAWLASGESAVAQIAQSLGRRGGAQGEATAAP